MKLGVLGSYFGSDEGVGRGLPEMGQKGPKHYKSRHSCHCLGSEITLEFLFRVVGCLFYRDTLYIYIYMHTHLFACMLVGQFLALKFGHLESSRGPPDFHEVFGFCWNTRIYPPKNKGQLKAHFKGQPTARLTFNYHKRAPTMPDIKSLEAVSGRAANWRWGIPRKLAEISWKKKVRFRRFSFCAFSQ